MKRSRKRVGDALPLSTSRHLRSYVRAIGQAALQWSVLHEAMAVIYMVLMKGEHTSQYLSVFAAINSDRGKRDALMAAARGMWIHPKAKDEEERHELAITKIKELVDAANGIEDTRNSIVHAPLHVSPVNAFAPTLLRVAPLAYLNNARAIKLLDKQDDLLSEYEWFRDYAILLGEFALDIARVIPHPEIAWPDKPRPPNRGQKKRVRKRPRPRT